MPSSHGFQLFIELIKDCITAISIIIYHLSKPDNDRDNAIEKVDTRQYIHLIAFPSIVEVNTSQSDHD